MIVYAPFKMTFITEISKDIHPPIILDLRMIHQQASILWFAVELPNIKQLFLESVDLGKYPCNPATMVFSLPLSASMILGVTSMSALCDSYQLYATVIGSMWQLSVLSNSYHLCATFINPIRQLLALCDSDQLYYYYYYYYYFCLLLTLF